MITFKDVKKTFKDGYTAIKGIDLEIPKGELVALIGPSGCGKTTTMKMINKLLIPTSGDIYINGDNISDKDPVELRRSIGYVIQQIGLMPHMTIEENVALIPKLKGWEKAAYQKRVDELLTLVGLEPSIFKKKYPLELSGGQQQRVGVIRALAAEPPIILMDEPFSALDPISREQLQDELKALQRQIQKTIVFVTHDIDEALKIADRIAIMKDGRIEQYTTPEELIKQPANSFVEQFIGEDRLNQVPANDKLMDLIEEFPVLSIERDFTTKLEAWPESMPDDLSEICVIDVDGQYRGTVFKEEMESNPMTKNLIHLTDLHVKPMDDIKEAARLIHRTGRTSIPVVEHGRYVGIVKKENIFTAMAGIKKEVNV
ncbi:ABC transporter ATP-binding protein [Falsibacillus albus]|uniref:Quaternary amine transport ATP-binding protein n=1 Tax=Falsibacillus albus TaxID=2478915 RepID=A0A3L7K0N9_9BACI|nr:betaine/proline/choline family ABC transporter ATP-binding protein [Falsibacillus albus]RLQ96155.1 ATP-binding cassette domain-containing protein [Falsibacillus albus]